MEVEEDLSERGGLVISDVSEFVSNLASSSAVHATPARPTQATREDSPEPVSTSSPTVTEKAQEDTVMEDTKEEEEEEGNFRSRTRAESEEAEDIAMKESNESAQAEPVCVIHFACTVVSSADLPAFLLCRVHDTNTVYNLHLNLFSIGGCTRRRASSQQRTGIDTRIAEAEGCL